MSFSQREEKRGDRLPDILTDEDAGLRLIVGGELRRSFRRQPQLQS